MRISTLKPVVIGPEDGRRIAVEQLIAEMARGNRGAIAPLYERTKAGVFGYALFILKNAHDAEDVLQEAYIRIYNGAGRYLPNGNPMPWIFSVVRNLCLMRIRDRNRTADVPDQSLEQVPDDNPLLTPEDRLVLTAAMEVLSEEESQIVVLHAVAGFKHREVAEHMELPLSTVLSKYHRAIGKMRRALEEAQD